VKLINSLNGSKGWSIPVKHPNASFSAQVVVKPQFQAASESVRAQFEGAGFTVGPLIGVSFSIAGPKDLFERYFKTQLDFVRQPDAVRSASSEDQMFPLDPLPEETKQAIQAVLVTRPPDFGPTTF